MESASDATGWETPLLTAPVSLPMSTVSSKSAGLFLPSAAMRSIRPFLAKTTLVSTPVFLVKASSRGLIR